MEIAIGFLIAMAIGLTGVGGGVITAPVLILYRGLPAPIAVGTALAFVVAVKSLAVPVYLYRKQVDWRILAYMLAGGVPGALAGSLLLRGVAAKGLSDLVLAAVGSVVVVSASLSLAQLALRKGRPGSSDRPKLLGALSAGIGVEVGFSSAGAGALGTVALFKFTGLPPLAVVGTDLAFGFVVSLIGGGFHLAAGTLDFSVLAKLVAGGIAGVTIGAHLASALPVRLLRAAILSWLIALGSQLCFKGIAAMIRTW